MLNLPYANRALFDQANYFFEICEYEKAQASINRVNGEVYKTPPDAVQLLKKPMRRNEGTASISADGSTLVLPHATSLKTLAVAI